MESKEIHTDLSEVKKIFDNLFKNEYKFVYILPSTGKFKGEKRISDFAFGYRQDCCCLDDEQNLDHFFKNSADLIKTMEECLVKGIKLDDIRVSQKP